MLVYQRVLANLGIIQEVFETDFFGTMRREVFSEGGFFKFLLRGKLRIGKKMEPSKICGSSLMDFPQVYPVTNNTLT